ncbi:MAG TPA: hypothetical protein VJQ06_05685 [Rhizomicrobium sp.]|nr:hypothetical protein [Rhizomicrobium sp.]
MANGRPRKSPPGESIFINCPFDGKYRPIFRAMIFTTIACGYHPRCALDSTDGAEVRVAKIAKMIRACDWAIHDLSRVEVRRGELPRFNMPLELGLHLGARLFGSGRQTRKRALILEAKGHRYDQVLSDISGQDVEIHAKKIDQAIACVRNWLSDHRSAGAPPLPGPKALLRDYKLFQRQVVTILSKHRLDPLRKLSHSDYLFAVRDWIEEESRRRTVKPHSGM